MRFMDNEDWFDQSVDRARKLYPNQGVQPVATLLARTGRYAIEYLEQAPAIIVFVTWGAEARTYADRAVIAQRFGSAVHRGPKLRELMAGFSAPLPLRALKGGACIPSNMSTILSLRKIPPSDLAQAIPEEIGQQIRWLRLLRDWLHLCGHYSFMKDFDGWWLWMVKASGAAIREDMPGIEKRAGDIFDFLYRGRKILNPDWTFRGALAATERWHKELAARQDQVKFLAQHGFGFEDRRDYAPLPETVDEGGFTFTALKSGLDLFLEGQAMRHCAANYVREVMLGGTRIYSIRQGEDRVATMELHPRGEQFVMAQLKGPCNSQPKKPVRSAAEAFLQASNEAIKRSLR